MTGNQIDITASDGKTFHGYLALPGKEHAPGVLLIQEIFGVNHHIKAVADKLAAEGFIVLAPDLFFRLQPDFQAGYEGKDMEAAFGMYQRFDEAKGIDDLGAAIKALQTIPECTGKIGTMGFCLGGKMAYRVAAHYPVAAVVSYYGGGIDKHLDEMDKIKAPIIMHFGARDTHIPLEAVQSIQEAGKKHHDCKIYIYNADHGFNCDERKSYDRPSAQQAWERSVEHLRSNLSG